MQSECIAKIDILKVVVYDVISKCGIFIGRSRNLIVNIINIVR